MKEFIKYLAQMMLGSVLLIWILWLVKETNVFIEVTLFTAVLFLIVGIVCGLIMIFIFYSMEKWMECL